MAILSPDFPSHFADPTQVSPLNTPIQSSEERKSFCTPNDAYLCFMRTEMDYLIMGNYLLDKRNQKLLTKDTDWQSEFELD